MTSLNLDSGYSDWLLEVFNERCRRNTSYSLRGFAKFLGISPSHLSEILKGTKGISSSKAMILASRLGLTPPEKSLLLKIVKAKHARSPKERIAAQNSLKSETPEQETYVSLSESQFQSVSGWEHYAIMELCDIGNIANTTATYANALELSEKQTELALKRLEANGMVGKKTKNGVIRWHKIAQNVTTSLNVPSSAIRAHHKQVLEKAISAVDNVPVNFRDISSVTLAIDIAKLPEAQRRIKKFRRELSAFLETGNKTDVYCLSLQLFPFTTPGSQP